MNICIVLLKLFSYCLARASYKRRLSLLLGVNIHEVDKFYAEINDSSFMKEILSKAGLKKGFFNFSMTNILRAPTLYVLCRLLRPEIVVETGVADGFSSAFILNALTVNNKGKLYSIDLPNQLGQELKKGKATGWLVPGELKKRWNMIIGSSKDKLPQLLKELKQIEIFYHDSDHSYENMMFEFKESLGFVRIGGLIISDDITDNNSFHDFCGLDNFSCLSLFKLGVIKKLK